MSLPKLFLKPGREKSARNRHPWLFSGAVASVESCQDGSLVQVYSSSQELLGTAYYNSQTSLCARFISFDARHPRDSIRDAIGNAAALRKRLVPAHTTGFRLINGEGDGVPGCIIDQYADVCVFQSATRGIDLLKDTILEVLMEECCPSAVFEKSDSSARSEEQLSDIIGPLVGTADETVEFLEYGNRFIADLIHGQKTGFFLDQREQRKFIGDLSSAKDVLNCFCYSGGFSVFAAKGGARSITSVDISARAIELAKKNFAQNGFSLNAGFECADVFEFLRREDQAVCYDIIVLDPPAFAKRKDQVVQACKGYADINREACRIIRPGGLLLTCSCSYHVDQKLFGQVVFQAARDSGRQVKIVGHHRQAFDHPVSIFHPEGSYLKSLLLYVE